MTPKQHHHLLSECFSNCSEIKQTISRLMVFFLTRNIYKITSAFVRSSTSRIETNIHLVKMVHGICRKTVRLSCKRLCFKWVAEDERRRQPHEIGRGREQKKIGEVGTASELAKKRARSFKETQISCRLANQIDQAIILIH